MQGSSRKDGLTTSVDFPAPFSTSVPVSRLFCGFKHLPKMMSASCLGRLPFQQRVPPNKEQTHVDLVGCSFPLRQLQGRLRLSSCYANFSGGGCLASFSKGRHRRALLEGLREVFYKRNIFFFVGGARGILRFFLRWWAGGEFSGFACDHCPDLPKHLEWGCGE